MMVVFSYSWIWAVFAGGLTREQLNELEFFDLKIIKRCKRFGLIVSVVGLF